MFLPKMHSGASNSPLTNRCKLAWSDCESMVDTSPRWVVEVRSAYAREKWLLPTAHESAVVPK